MSLRSIINFKDALDLVIGVNVKLLDNDRQDISYCILKREKDILSLFEKRDGISDVTELYSYIKTYVEKGVRVHVNCLGRSVLTKIIPGKQTDASRQLADWFPGIVKDNFIFQSFIRANFTALSLLRSEEAKKANLFLDDSATSFSVGVCIAETIASISGQKSITLEGYRIGFDSQQIQSLESSQENSLEEYQLGSDVIPASCILAYASALNFFLPLQDVALEGQPASIGEGHLRFQVNRRLHQVGKVVIIALLCLLPLNLILYFWFDGQVTEMESAVQFRQGSRKTMEQSAMSTQKLSSVYDGLGYSTNRMPLYYADQLARTMPVEIQLNVLHAGLLDEKTLRSERRLQFDALQIKIQGTSRDPAVLNNWITMLGKLDWATSIRDQKYQFDPHLGKGVFEFIILVKPDHGKTDL